MNITPIKEEIQVIRHLTYQVEIMHLTINSHIVNTKSVYNSSIKYDVEISHTI